MFDLKEFKCLFKFKEIEETTFLYALVIRFYVQYVNMLIMS